MNNTELEWMRFEETHGKVHVIVQQFERIFHKERNDDQRDATIFTLIKGYARTHLHELLEAGQKNQNLESYIRDPRLRAFWRQTRQEHMLADAEQTTENITPN